MGVERPEVAVLGAGVIGLSCAYELAKAGYRVCILARDLPDDLTSTAFSSPWAGANWTAFQNPIDYPRLCQWEAETFPRLAALIPSGLAMPLLNTRRFARDEAGLHLHWYRNILPNYKRLPPSECPEGQLGVQYDTLSVHAPKYCQWLQAECTKLAVTFERITIQSVDELYRRGHKVIINASGLGAKKLKGIEDANVYSIRGQTVLIKSNLQRCTMSDGGRGLPAYMIPRPGGEVICGGTYMVNDENTTPDMDTAKAILERCLALEPSISKDGTIDGIDVIRHNVGLRPARQGGPRVEVDFQNFQPDHLLIHAYGLGPAGYQASWGVAQEVLRLLTAFKPLRPAKL